MGQLTFLLFVSFVFVPFVYKYTKMFCLSYSVVVIAVGAAVVCEIFVRCFIFNARS